MMPMETDSGSAKVMETDLALPMATAMETDLGLPMATVMETDSARPMVMVMVKRLASVTDSENRRALDCCFGSAGHLA